MGGTGSGQWHRTGTKDRTTLCIRLEIRCFKDRKQFYRGSYGQMQWRDRLLSFELNEEGVLLGVFPELDSLHLAGKSCQVKFERTPCHFGGAREWFVCPCCERRAGILYLEHGKFACRKCRDVAYPSQLESRASRLITKAHKVRRRLGASGSLVAPTPDKPKGMHYSTYWRSLLQLNEIMKEINHAVITDL